MRLFGMSPNYANTTHQPSTRNTILSKFFSRTPRHPRE